MMSWFRRAHDALTPEETDQEDSPAELTAGVRTLVAFINSSAGRLPAEAVVVARRATDALHSVIDTAEDSELDIHAIVSIKGIVNDYLPTTLRAYLALDPTTTDTPRPSGRTPKDSLVEQVNALWSAAMDVLVATQAQDADALVTQGNFLRTKFSRSDLDL